MDRIISSTETNRRRLLIVANVSKEHIRKFHLPFIAYMRSHGWTVDVACRMDAPVPECDNFYDLPCDRNPLKFGLLKSSFIVKKIVSENRYDAVICNTLTGGIVARLGAKLFFGKNAPTMFYLNHGLHFFKGAAVSRWLMGYPMEKLLAPLTDIMITINKVDHETAVKYLKPKHSERLNGIGVDLERFRNCRLSDFEKTELRSSLGLGEDDLVLTYVAEISSNKNQVQLVRTLVEVRKEIPNAKLMLVGPERDNGRTRLLARELGCSDQVFFLDWRNDVPQLLNISDIYLASSISEGLGINIIEAVACNLPVVATNNRGHSEIIEHGTNGFIVEIGNAEKMAGFVKAIYNDAVLRESFVSQGQKSIEKFSQGEVVREEERILLSYIPKTEM